MTYEDRTPLQDIELAGTFEPQGSMVLEDEMQLVLKKAGDRQKGEITKLLVEPRRPYPRSAGI
ncbi:hypothetical protein SAMN05428942_7251 [Streptomyces sp. 2112.2]|uniref:hypothetical protein n=1 Tax=Streptomyces sp. 2112.2 TaxID=1881024 RepID=UPI00089B40BD|nr:hypothetical protein [Streptomyces sp. 2112.2]SEF16359.1 hypothetical protein SAMN05428942_7251 [Streptomyces sp. 2112.2]